MDCSAFEFALWALIVLLVFYVFNEVLYIKRLPGILFATLVASIVVYASSQSVLSETLLTASLIGWTIYGFTNGFRSFRSDKPDQGVSTRKSNQGVSTDKPVEYPK